MYSTYNKRYNKQMELIAKESERGIPVPEMTAPYNYNQFKMVYTAMENTRQTEISKGRRKVLNITQDMVRKQQKYELSYKQAVHIRRALTKYTDGGYTISLRNLMLYGTNMMEVMLDQLAEDYGEIHEIRGDTLLYNTLLADIKRNVHFRNYIRQTIFGSPP